MKGFFFLLLLGVNSHRTGIIGVQGNGTRTNHMKGILLTFPSC